MKTFVKIAAWALAAGLAAGFGTIWWFDLVMWTLSMPAHPMA